MKKSYIICLFLFIGVGVYFGAYFFARTHFHSQDYYDNRFMVKEESETVKIEPLKEAAVNEQVICNLTSIIEEEYDVDSGKLSEQKIDTPVGLLGYSRDKLIIYMKQYMKSPSKEDCDKGMIAFELISFSREKVVWRKSFTRKKEVEFLGKNENGYLTIYLPDGKTLYDYTNIYIEQLPPAIWEKLEDGIEFTNSEELYDFLETYTS